MNTRPSRIAFAPPSLVSEALSEACLPVGAPSDRKSEIFGIGRIRQKFSSDEKLALELQSGNADALTELFKRHSGLLFGLARRIVRNNAEAEDVVQQTFLDVFRSIHQFDPDKGPFKAWLLMYVYHRAFNHFRAMNANRFFVTDPLDEVLPIVSKSATEVRILVDQALSLLSARERQTIELIYYNGFTAVEVASVSNQTVRVVRHNLYRGLEKLRKILSTNDSRAQAKGDLR